MEVGYSYTSRISGVLGMCWWWWRGAENPQRGGSRGCTPDSPVSAHYPATLRQVAQSLSCTEAQGNSWYPSSEPLSKKGHVILYSRNKDGMAVATAPKQAWPPWPPVFFLLLLPALGSSGNCPAVCDCTSQPQAVLCAHRRLEAVPGGLPLDTELLDLSGDRLWGLQQGMLSRLGQLQELDLSYNQLSTLEPGARGLTTGGGLCVGEKRPPREGFPQGSTDGLSIGPTRWHQSQMQHDQALGRSDLEMVTVGTEGATGRAQGG